jgi:hypothetical protein
MALTASCPPPQTDGSGSIAVASWNIHNGCNGGLESALRAMEAMGINLGVFLETKVTGRMYTWNSSGYSVVASDAPSVHQGGIALFWRANKAYEVEDWHIRGRQHAILCGSHGEPTLLHCGMLHPTHQP